MFQFSGFPTYGYVFTIRWYQINDIRFPHSEIRASMDICSLTRLIAACHVLHRLLMPRHSPCALISLTIFSLLILRITLVILQFALFKLCEQDTFVKLIVVFITFKTKKTLILYFYSRLLVNLYYLVFNVHEYQSDTQNHIASNIGTSSDLRLESYVPNFQSP